MNFASVLNRIYRPESAPTDFDVLGEAEKLLTETRITDPPKEDTIYRISKLPMVCARQEVLRAIHRVPHIEKIRAKQRRTFDFGHTFHRLAQEDWFGKWGWLVGTWKCKCGFFYHGVPRPERCYQCNGDAFHYIERDLYSEQYGVSGHPDGLIVKNGVKKILELKTANSYYYKQITEVHKRAIEAHVDQANLYMWLTGIKKAVIIYIDKDSSNWAQFPREYSEAITEKYVDKLHSIRHGIKTGSLPGRVCENSECSRARSCPVRKQCFGL